jgi:hypothetical protein
MHGNTNMYGNDYAYGAYHNHAPPPSFHPGMTPQSGMNGLATTPAPALASALASAPASASDGVFPDAVTGAASKPVAGDILTERKASDNVPILADNLSTPTRGGQQQQVKQSRRAATRLVKLEVKEHSSGAVPIVTSEQAWPAHAERPREAISEEMPLLDDPFLSVTLRQYARFGKQAGKSGKPAP